QARSLDGSLGPNGRPRAGTLHREQQLDVAHHVLRPARFAGSPCFGPPRRAARGARRHVPRPAGGWQARSLDGSLGPNGRPRAGTLHREQQLDVAHHVLRPARFAGSPCFGPPRRAARGARRHVPRPAGGWQARSLDGSLGPNGRPRAGTLHREQQLDVAHHVLRPARFAGSPCFGPPRRAARGARRHVPRPAGGWQARSLDGSLGPNGRPRAGTLHREQQLDVAHHVLRPARFAGSPCFGPPRRAARGARRHVPRPAGGWQARSLDGSLGPNGRPRAGTLHREQQLDVAHHVLRPARFAGSPCFGPPRRAARGARRHVPRPAGGWQARSLDGSLGPNGRPRAGTLHREQQLDVAHHVLRPARFAGSPCFGPPRRAARGARRHVPRPAGGWQARSLDGSLGPNGRRAGTLHREQQLDVAHHVLRPARFAGSPCFGPPRRAARGARRHVPRPAGGVGRQARSLDGSLGPNGRPRAGTLHREQQLDVAHHVLRPARFTGSPCFGPPRRAARGARRHVPRPAGGWQARSLDGSLGPNGRPRAGTLHREQQLDVAHHVLRPARFAGSPCFGPPRRAARGARRHVPRPAGGWQARSLDGSLGPNGRPRAGTLHREQQLDVAHHVLRPARFAGSPCFGPPRRAARGARRHVPRPAGGWQARSLDGSLGPNGRPRAGTLHREQQLDVAHHVLRPARFAGSPCFGPPRRAARGARRHVPRPAGG
ncbi:hypothetical protein ACJX0J_004355, partial [Zea mays]